MRKFIAVFLNLLLIVFLASEPAKASAPSNSELKALNLLCSTIPNGSILSVVDTTRAFVNLPKAFYPDIKLNVSSKGSIARVISNGGAYGYAMGAKGNSQCWSYYFGFELNPSYKSGRVAIGARSGVRGVPDYLIHFTVVSSPPSATVLSPSRGEVKGVVLLGPVCPVEKTPSDPACAPKPYESTINIWSTWTGSSYRAVKTDANGIFTLYLQPGSYSVGVAVAANGPPYPRCTQVNMDVVAKKSQSVTINCDTGIR